MLFYATLILAMCLKIAPLPDILSNLNPDWVLLTLIYWALAVPEKVGVFSAWLTGLLVDVLTAQFLGQQALIYSLIIYATLKLHKRLRQYTPLRQSVFIFASLGLAQTVLFCLESLIGTEVSTWVFWLPVLTGAVVWRLIYTILRYIRIMGQVD